MTAAALAFAPPVAELAPRILVVDDSTTIKRTAKLFLEQAGYAVDVIDDGFAAAAAIVRSRPALMIMDVVMPRLDGLSTCALIRQHPRFRDLPIILLTSKDSALDRARGRLQGATAYLSKPFAKAQLLEVVSKFVSTPNGANP